MVIDDSNYKKGNQAMACILLLYYHLIREDGITFDQTVYIETWGFDGFSFLDVKVDEAYCEEIDAILLREGAIISILCDLNDWISNYDDTYLLQAPVINVIDAYEQGKFSAIPETADLITLINTSSYDFDHKKYRTILNSIYQKYVFNKARKIIGLSPDK